MDEAQTETSTGTEPAAARSVAPGITDLLCPFGHIVGESQDRRWLWSAHEILTRAEAAAARADGAPLPVSLVALRQEMGRHLAETCEHHWEVPVDEDDLLGGIERCLWCETPKPKGSWFGNGRTSA